MSLEAKIEELTGTMTALIAALNRTSDNQERLLAGQEKAIEQVKAGNPTTAATRGRKPKEVPAAETTTDQSAATESGADVAKTADETPAAAPKEETAPAPAEKEKATFAVAAKRWMDRAEKGSADYKARGTLVMGILAKFGAGKMSELDEANEDAAMFYLKRSVKGLPVNFDAAYDFAGDPEQPEPEAAADAAADDDEDMFA